MGSGSPDPVTPRTLAFHARPVRPRAILDQGMTLKTKDIPVQFPGMTPTSRDQRRLATSGSTGVPVHCKLPGPVVEALSSLPRLSELHWFWTGQGSVATPAGNYRRAFRRLCELAEVKGGHPRRFRDTFAVELLLAGVPMERVSVLLGHSSMKVTEQHYAPWVRARQEQLEADLARVWQTDAVLLTEQAQKQPGAVQ